ncbi:hypothetical protein FHR81_005103 [Actinoalloteichus hoggarensis]|uniref:Uncharacterized protein n=1 Tax=Actinoalloteichus hoggarensis TaxID=1470176 RepID=A0A221WA10_9PSEU|nr:hypothetical protein [Actinoalloteichus hoggarensis]ASO22832.1 hypothetical protein AHOG_26135 [Actinoalloteichus hoggarensis]MBB5924026.1 hypothetical protein [Actinoalloteichus hoggarensis]
MSVSDVVGQLRRAHALLTEARRATIVADAAITDGAEVFGAATVGSSQPEVARINRLARASGVEVRAAHVLFGRAQDLIDGYCHEIAGHGIGDAGPPVAVSPSADDTATRPPPPDQLPPDQLPPEVRYAEQIAELRRDGVKISPEKVVRVGRHQRGHLVWLERGDIESRGEAHILRPDRAEQFEKKGVPADRIVELIFAGIERGRHIGYVRRDCEIYEVDCEGRPQRFAVVIADNGFIVTAHPSHTDGRENVRPHRPRRNP